MSWWTRRCIALLALGSACATHSSAVVEISVSPPAALTRAPTPGELAETQRRLEEADAAFFRGDYAEARKRFEHGWERSHPNPLALVMASHAAVALGDARSAQSLLGRAREEARERAARVSGKPNCSLTDTAMDIVDLPGAAWLTTGDGVFRVDAKHHRVLYGFCGEVTQDHALSPFAPVSWISRCPVAEWLRSPAIQGEWSSETIEIRDVLHRTPPIHVKHRIYGSDVNEGYTGAIGYSRNGAFVASGADAEDEEIRVWRTANGSLVQGLDFRGALHMVYLIVFSPDALLVAAADCHGFAVWEVATGRRTLLAQMKPMQCIFGGGLSNPVERLIISHDNNLIAAFYLVMGPIGDPVPQEEEGYYVAVYQTRDGKLVRRYHLRDTPSPDVRAFTPDNNALVGYEAVFDLRTGNQRKLTLKADGMPAGAEDWLVGWDRVVDLGPGTRAEAYPMDVRNGEEMVGPYWIPKSP